MRLRGNLIITMDDTFCRTNEGAGMYNMDSIVCQPTVNHSPKKSKVRGSSPATTYKHPSQMEDQRSFNNRLPALPQPVPLQPQSTSAVVSRVSPFLPHQSTPTHPIHQRMPEQPSMNHQNYPPRQPGLEQRHGAQHQVSNLYFR